MKFKPNDYFLKQYPDLLNTKEVGEILRICQKSVYKMIQSGELKTIVAILIFCALCVYPPMVDAKFAHTGRREIHPPQVMTATAV